MAVSGYKAKILQQQKIRHGAEGKIALDPNRAWYKKCLETIVAPLVPLMELYQGNSDKIVMD